MICIRYHVHQQTHSQMKRILAINPPVMCVNQCQKEWYSFAHPTSLLKIIAYHKAMGHQVEMIDCMAYEAEWNNPLLFYKKMLLGTQRLKLEIDTFILGNSFEWLQKRLAEHKTPDEIWVSCHITFNAALAHKTIRTVSNFFNGIPIIFGGNYPTLFPDLAGQSGARVFEGRLPEALTCFPDYSVFHTRPDYCVFQLALGCENNCTHCVNPMLGPVVHLDIDALVKDIKSKQSDYGIRTFINIDPNIGHFGLEAFLETIIRQNVDVDLYLFGGIQPDTVTRRLVTLMQKAHVRGISLPRELNQELNTTLGKKYNAADFYKAVRLFEKEKYDMSNFHCPFPVALKEDNTENIFAIIREIKALGAVAEIAPVSFIPGTIAYRDHRNLLAGKDLEELNWALWPSLDAIDKLRFYASLYNLAHDNRFVEPWRIPAPA